MSVIFDVPNGFISSNGNLTLSDSGAQSFNTGYSTFTVSSGKVYWEIHIDATNAPSSCIVGFGVPAYNLYPGIGVSWGYSGDGYGFYNGTYHNINTSYGVNDIIGIALDLDNGKVFFAKNNTWVNSCDPVTGNNPIYTGVSGSVSPGIRITNLNILTATGHFKSSSQIYAPPSGFSSLEQTITQNVLSYSTGGILLGGNVYTSKISVQKVLSSSLGGMILGGNLSVIRDIIHFIWTDVNNNNVPISPFTEINTISGVRKLYQRTNPLILKGALIEPQNENFCLFSNDLTYSPWILRGTAVIDNNATGPGNNTNSASSVMINISGINDVYQNISGIGNINYFLDFYIKKITLTGILEISNPQGFLFGQYHLDLSQLDTEWTLININHPALTIIYPMKFNSSNGGIQFGNSIVGDISFELWGCKLSTSISGNDSPIITTSIPVIRPASVLSYNKSNEIMDKFFGVFFQIIPSYSNQVNASIFGTYANSNNYTSILCSSSNSITVRKRIAGINYDATSPIIYSADIALQGVAILTDKGISIKTRLYSNNSSSWEVWGSWVDNNNTTSPQIGSTYQIGSLNSINQFAANYQVISAILLQPELDLDEYKAQMELILEDSFL